MPAKNIASVKLAIKNKIEEISQERTRRAVYAILSQGQTMAALMVPIDTGFLINSAFGPVMMQDGKTGRVGYAAEYAKWVHDAPGKLKGQPRADFGKTATGVGTYWSPAGKPGFLVKGFEQLKPAIPNILKAVYGS